VLIGVLALAVGAVIIDKAYLGPATGPASAMASDVQPVDETPLTEPPAASTPPARQETKVSMSLADRLRKLAAQVQPDGTPDAFCPSQAWLEQATEKVQQEAPPNLAQVFAQTHELQSVIIIADEARAVVNDRYMAIGQSIDGFELKSVTPRWAVFESDGQRAVLKLKEPSQQ